MSLMKKTENKLAFRSHRVRLKATTMKSFLHYQLLQGCHHPRVLQWQRELVCSSMWHPLLLLLLLTRGASSNFCMRMMSGHTACLEHLQPNSERLEHLDSDRLGHLRGLEEAQVLRLLGHHVISRNHQSSLHTPFAWFLKPICDHARANVASWKTAHGLPLRVLPAPVLSMRIRFQFGGYCCGLCKKTHGVECRGICCKPLLCTGTGKSVSSGERSLHRRPIAYVMLRLAGLGPFQPILWFSVTSIPEPGCEELAF